MLFEYGNPLIPLFQMLTILGFEYKVLKTYIGRKTICPFLKNCDLPSQKYLSAHLIILFLQYQVTKILSNNLLQTLCNLIVRRVTKDGGFYNKYLDWGCVNKWS